MTETRGKKAGASKPARALPFLANGTTTANVDAMRRALAVLEVDVAREASPEALLDALRAKVAPLVRALDPAERCTCEDCGEVSTDATSFCPFCGAEGVIDDRAPTTVVSQRGHTEAIAVSQRCDTDRDTAALASRAKQLDAIVERIEALKANVATNSYDLGEAIRKIHADDLWKARGRASFAAFCETDLEISRQSAHKLMGMVANFDRATFARVGSAKLWLVAQVDDPAAREQALADAVAGKSLRQIERSPAVQDARAARAKPGPVAAREPAPPKRTDDSITLLARVGSRAALHPWRSAKSREPLAAYAPDAFVEVPISENVVVQLALKADANGAFVGITSRFVRVEK